jgi:putative membrane protein insertion efficiency factor
MCNNTNRKSYVNVCSPSVVSQSIKLPIILLIKVYRWFSPLKQIILGPYARCRFYPTCSEYSLECFRHLPLLQAITKSLSRIARCNPMHSGGYDPLFPKQDDDQSLDPQK